MLSSLLYSSVSIYLLFVFSHLVTIEGRSVSSSPLSLDITTQLMYAQQQYKNNYVRWQSHQKDYPHIGPPNIDWEYEPGTTPFTGGFFSAIFWALYSYTNDTQWLIAADSSQMNVAPIANVTSTHDVGFNIYYTYGRGYQLTQNSSYLPIAHLASTSLSTRYSDKIGCTRSWDEPTKPKEDFWVIIDNMMNLELLWWSSLEFNNLTWYHMAHTHASRTMVEHYRPDDSSYHVVEYNETTGNVISKHNSQGYADYSMWARGQAWGIYGFVMSFRYTGFTPFLRKSVAAANRFLIRLKEEVDDHVPYWDFDAPYNTSYQPRDTSACAIVSSALLELSTYGYPSYKQEAITLLTSLSSNQYFIINNVNTTYKINALLAHGTSNWPNNVGLDYSLIYGDYYYVEALVRLYQMDSGIETDFMKIHKKAMSVNMEKEYNIRNQERKLSTHSDK